MADMNELYGALQKADAAGDAASAKILADYIRSQTAAQPAPQEPARTGIFADAANREAAKEEAFKGFGTTIADLLKMPAASVVGGTLAIPSGAEQGIKGLARKSMEGQPEALMPASVYQPGIDTEEALFGPETDQQKAQRQLNAQRAVAAMPSIPGAKELAKVGRDAQKNIEASISPESKKAIEESQVTGNIFKGEIEFGTNPTVRGYAMQAASVFGSLVPVVVSSIATKSPAVGGGVGGAMAADEAGTNAAEFINKLSDQQLAEQSPFYSNMIAGGASPTEARALTVKKAAETGAALQGLVAMGGDTFTGKLVTGAFDKLLSKIAGQSALGKTAAGMGLSGLEQGLSETGEGVASDIGTASVVPSKEIGEGSAQNLVMGVLGGVGPGALSNIGKPAEGAERKPVEPDETIKREPYVREPAADLEALARSKGFLRPQAQQPEAPVTVPPSESMDLQAMMDELMGKPPVYNKVIVEEPTKAEPVKAEEPPKPEEPAKAEEPPAAKTEAEYQKDIRRGMASINAVREKQITQEQYEEYQALAEVARKELDKLQSKQATTLSPAQQEAIQIAERMEALGEKNFTAGVRNAARNPSVERNLPFYRERLADLESKRGATDQVFSETHSLKDLMRIESDKGVEKFEQYQKTAAPATRAAVERAGEVVQQVKDAINSAGYAVNDIGASSPYELQKLKNLHSQLEAGITQVLTQHNKLATGHKVSSQEALDKRINILKTDINKSSQELRRYAQLSPEIREQEEAVTVAKRAADKTARESGSLWGSLVGKLDQGEVRDIFSANPNFGQKRLQIKGGKKVTGAQVSDIVADGGLDQFLPPDMRHDSPTFDEKDSTDLIKQKIREQDYLPFDAKIEIEQIFGSVQEAERLVDEFLTIEEQNLELQTAADEQREGEINAQEVEPGVENRAAEPAEREAREPAQPERIYLNVPFQDNERAKQRGALWDADKKLWYMVPIERGPAQGEYNINLKRYIPNAYEVRKNKDEARAAAANMTIKTGREHRVEKITDGVATGYGVVDSDGVPLNEGMVPVNAAVQAPAELELSTQTKEELQAKQAEVDRLNKENERLTKEAEAKAKADAERGEFVLTGSDRAADVAAAQGQKDIFGAMEEEAPAEDVNEEGVKVVPFEADAAVVGDLLKETKPEENPFDTRFNALMHPVGEVAKPKATEFLTPKEAEARVNEWRAEASRQGKTNKNSGRTILSLFDASGEWSKPWREAGYDVLTFDIQTGEDINDFSAQFMMDEGLADANIWGILAAPPCTDFASSGAQYWAKKDAKGQTEASNELVRQVLRTVEFLQPKVWALENPVGRIAKLNNLPPAHLTFDPNVYGDPYTKKTLLWGNFDNNLPTAPVEPTEGSRIIKLSGKDKYARSLTPEGFAYAFFMANNAESMSPAERLARTYYGVDPKAFDGATEADEKAIKDSAFEDDYFDGNLEDAANIAREVIGKQPAQEAAEEFTPLKGEDGKPVVVYRGSLGEERDAFTPTNFFGSGFFGKGINLTSSPEDASKYASTDAEVNIDLPGRASVMADALGIDYNEAKAELTKGGGKVYPLFVSINNPLVIGQEKIVVPEKVLRLALAESNFEGSDADADRFVRQFTQAADGVAQFQTVVNNKASTIYRQIASLQNKDGLIIEPEVAPKSKGATHYLVFEKDQVKSIFEGQEQSKQEAKPNTVTTPDGAVLRYPVALDMVKNGYKVLALDDPRTYVDKGGKPHRTFEKDGVRLALSPQQVLFEHKGRVQLGRGNDEDVTLEVILVDPQARGQGKANQALEDLVSVADKNGLVLFAEPVPLKDKKTNKAGLDFDQLVKLYKKFGFDFPVYYNGSSTKVMERQPQTEVLPAEEPQIAGQLENEPYTFEGEFTEIGEEEQRTLITDQTSKLSDAQLGSLEKFYGFARDTEEFANAVRQDVVNFITKGATYVNGKIRAIIRSMSNGVLSVAVAFNPQFVSQPYTIAVPQFETRIEQVMQEVPAEVQGQMSDDAKRAYATIYPAIKGELQSNDKFFIVADKQTANTFVFNPDGSPFMASKTLFGAGIGDFMKGDNNIVANRITPAGLFNLGLRDAKRSAGEAVTAGEYDFGKVFVLDKSYMGANGPYSNTIMHSVWTKETDAKQRLAALQKPGAEDSRYSFGCINVDKDTYGKLVTNNLAQMDGAKIFIVPENGKDVMSFVNGEATYSTDIIRQRAEPVTREVKQEVQRAAPKAEAERTVAAKEEEGPVYNSIEAETAGWSPSRIDQLINEFGYTDGRTFGMAGYVNPADFVKATTPTIEAAEMLNEEAGKLDVEAIRAERQTPFLFWDIDKGAIIDHEGRHRMAALARTGVTRAPVVLVVRDRYGSKKPDQYTPEDNVFISGQGFQGGKGQGLSVENLVPLSYKYKEQLGQNFGKEGFLYSLNPAKFFTSAVDEERKRSPSFKRRMDKLNRDRLAGKITDEEFINQADWALKQSEKNRLSKEPAEKQRGYLELVKRLSEAAKRGEISLESFELATWFMRNSPDLVEDLGVRILSKGKEGVGGQYSTFNRVMVLIKGGGSDLTVVHEILHHLERMMPPKIQQAIRAAWAKQLAKALKNAKTPGEKLYFKALMNAHYGNNNLDYIDVPNGPESVIFNNALGAMLYDMPGSKSSFDLAETLLKMSALPISNYQYFNPSEFWAVNGSQIVQGRFDAVQGGVLARLKNWLKELGQKIKSLFGFKSTASIIRALDSLSKADGQFVTEDMLGRGDYQNIHTNYKGGEMPNADWAMRETGLWDSLIQEWQDSYRDLKNVQAIITNQFGKMNQLFNAYDKEILSSGREAERLEDFTNHELRPLIKDMLANKVTNDELAKYMHNRYAKERNDIINEKNQSPSVRDKGSGISTEDAAKYLRELDADRKKTLEGLAKQVDAIVRKTQDALVESGQETQETIDEWRRTSPHYIPLNRDESELDFVIGKSGISNMKGLATRGGFGKQALGSTKTVVNILENVMLQRGRAVHRGEAARIGKALYGMSIAFPNTDFWMPINPDATKNKEQLLDEMEAMGLDPEFAENLLAQPKTARLSKTKDEEGKEIRTVTYQVDRNYQMAKNVFPVRINGKDRFILFNPKSPEAQRLVGVLKDMDSQQLGAFVGAASTLTRWFSAVNSQYNPAFGLVNLWNDVQGGLANLSTTELADKKKEVFKNVLPALAGLGASIRRNRYQDVKQPSAPVTILGKEVASEKWGDLWERMRLAGGKTGYRGSMVKAKLKFDLLNPDFKKKITAEDEHLMESELRALERGPLMKKAVFFADLVSDFNDTLENAVRLSAFEVAVRPESEGGMGMTDEEAAVIAKTLTINFNKHGGKTKNVRGLYAFFNAGVQNTARTAVTLAGPAGKTIIKYGLMLGAVNALLMLAAGFDDDEPPEYMKNKGFIIPLGHKDYFLFNLPGGFRAIPNTGRLLMEGALISLGVLHSNKGLGGKVVDAGMVLVDAVNPLGNGGGLQTLAPTFLDPYVAITTNRDAFGRPISKEDQSLNPTAGWLRTRDNASEFSKGLAYFMNYITAGGEPYRKGFVSPTGDQLDYLFAQIGGGAGKEASRLATTISNKIKGEETPAFQVPMLNRVYGELGTPQAVSARFYDNITMLSEHKNIIEGRAKDGKDIQGYMNKNPQAKFAFAADDIDNEISNINATIHNVKKLPSTKENKETIKKLEEGKTAMMANFNRLVKAAK